MGDVVKLPTAVNPVDVDHAGHEVKAQRAAEEHLAACQDAMYEADNIADPDKWPPSPALAPFCGCDTCVIREVLHAAWPHLMNAAREEIAHEAR